jgi:hypothetical protein
MYLAYLGNNKIKEENIMSFIIIVSVIIYFKFLEGMIKDKEIRFIINCCFIWVLMIIVASFCSLNSNCITPIINDYNSGKIIVKGISKGEVLIKFDGIVYKLTVI